MHQITTVLIYMVLYVQAVALPKSIKKYKETLSPDYKQSVDDEVVENFHFLLILYILHNSCTIHAGLD